MCVNEDVAFINLTETNTFDIETQSFTHKHKPMKNLLSKCQRGSVPPYTHKGFYVKGGTEGNCHLNVIQAFLLTSYTLFSLHSIKDTNQLLFWAQYPVVSLHSFLDFSRPSISLFIQTLLHHLHTLMLIKKIQEKSLRYPNVTFKVRIIWYL